MKKQITMIFIMALLFLIFDCDKSFADNYNTDDAIVYETDEVADTVKSDDRNAGESVDKLNKKKARGVYINKRTIKIKSGKK